MLEEIDDRCDSLMTGLLPAGNKHVKNIAVPQEILSQKLTANIYSMKNIIKGKHNVHFFKNLKIHLQKWLHIYFLLCCENVLRYVGKTV